MALDEPQKNLVKAAISAGLDRAEAHWEKLGNEIVRKMVVAADSASVFAESVEPSKIPGHPLVFDSTPKVDEFIALVVDMRKSSEHLKSRVNSAKIKYGFQRVYYETSALLPAIAVVAGFKNGSVTEYLGDGALVLFQVGKENRDDSIKGASIAARNCIGDMRDLINAELQERYSLPRLDLGAGLSMSKAMVTLVGTPDNQQPKAIGECIWEATKLSGGTNIVVVSDNMYQQWPKSEGGTLKFLPKSIRNISGYKIY